MTKTFILNIENLHSAEDVTKIRDHFMNRPGIEKVDIEMGLKLVSLRYNDQVGSPSKLLEALDYLGYSVR